MALRGLRSAFGRGDKDPASDSAGARAADGTPVVGWGPPADTGVPERGFAAQRDANAPAGHALAGRYAPATLPSTMPQAAAGVAASIAPGSVVRPGNWSPRAAAAPARETLPSAASAARPGTAAAPPVVGPTATAPAPGAASGRAAAPATAAGPATIAAPSEVHCPSCGRPIPRGTVRCAGCGQRLLLDVPARKASMLVGGGVVAGLLIGGLLVGLALPRATSPAATGPGPSASGPALVGVSGNAAAALRGTTVLNGRLAAEADPLAAAAAASPFQVQDVVNVLRRMSSDTRAAAAMVPSLGDWPDAAAQQAALTSLYDELGAEIDGALTTTSSNTGAYRTAAKAILTTLGKIVALDATARRLATSAGLELPTVTIPGALR